ncbi:MAG: hypothetical protein NUV86_09625 [Candidatus Scalindua sp.]|nr:hypothetical protein [Candidatus Scalindua sp.]MCR4345215.1 hypothetical protein [Candidatus Scalindua sp.]
MKPDTGNACFTRILNAVLNGSPVYVRPYKEPKVWGVDGIGEYWYGAEEGEKSSTAVVGKDAFSLYKIIENGPEKFLGEKVVARFGKRLPLVKILTPKSRLSVQFHDNKNELWIITGTDKEIAGGTPWIITGFSRKAVELYGKAVTGYYKGALAIYGEALNNLIEIMIDSGYEKLLDDKKDVELASQEVVHSKPGSSEIAGDLEKLKAAKRGLDVFYNRQYVEIGDVIPIPSGTLHALGPGVEVVEPQIAGPTQSLEDGTTYPVRYAFPAYPREGAIKMLEIDRVHEMLPEVMEKTYPEVADETDYVLVERLPGKFEDKGLEVHRITFKDDSEYQQSPTSFHTLIVLVGDARLCINDKEYNIPNAAPDGEMLIVPASAGHYKIHACKNTQIIDTFTPV